jgi:hypothetical protein
MKAGTLNSQSELSSDLIKSLMFDACILLEIPLREAERDSRTVRNRLRKEGFSFASKTLPKFGSAVDKALQTGTFQSPTSFKLKKGTRLPCFLYGLAERIFDVSGVLREDACVYAIRHIRQITYSFYKYKLPYSEDTLNSFYTDFVKTDSVVYGEAPLTVEQMSNIYYGGAVIDEIFSDFSLCELVPKNGPGSVAKGERQWERYRPHRFYQELDELCSYHHAFSFSDRHLFDYWDLFWNLPFGDYGTAKLMAVDKDSRGPRLISSEPHEKMSYQQALRLKIYPYVENHPLTAGQVNFTDQTINGDLALSSSVSQELCTLDLSKASDLLSNTLVYELFENTVILDWLMKSRSKRMLMPDGSTVELKKFAPMGNALTFPIQALCFYALIVGRFVALGMDLRHACKLVWVYGDDIIVPRTLTDEAISVLTDMGLRINTSKSCTEGNFRESCGVDAWHGHDITPLKFKKVFTHDKNAVTELIAWTTYSNTLFESGHWRTADYIRNMLERVHGTLPCVTSHSPIIGFLLPPWETKFVKEANESKLRYSQKWQCDTLRGIQPVAKSRCYLDEGWERLLNWAWNSPDSNEEPFSTGSFTVRHTVTKKHVVVGVHHV